jgi:hypothetical protein
MTTNDDVLFPADPNWSVAQLKIAEALGALKVAEFLMRPRDVAYSRQSWGTQALLLGGEAQGSIRGVSGRLAELLDTIAKAEEDYLQNVQRVREEIAKEKQERTGV